MKRKALRDENGDKLIVSEGASCDIVLTLKDTAGATVSAVQTAVFMLYDDEKEGLINSHSATDVSSSFSGGVLTIELDASDNVIANTDKVTEGDTELHVCRVTFTWLDASSDTRTSIEEYTFLVERLNTPS